MMSRPGGRIVPIVIGLYLLLVLAASFYFRISLTPDRIILLLVIAALGTGRIRLFLKDWSIFLIVLLAWQVLTGMSRHFGNLKPHVGEMIDFDRTLFFGHVPTIWLQQHFYHHGAFIWYHAHALLGDRYHALQVVYIPGRLVWYDVGATILYLLHFAFPMGIAFALWIRNRPLFLEFMVSFLVLALAGFATFVLFPAA